MLEKFAPTNIFSNLKENKKNCLVIVGKEPIQISTIFSASEALVIVIPDCLNFRWRVLLKVDVPPEIEIESKFALISPLN